MSVIVLLIVAGGLVAGGFLIAFVWAVRSGQFDDTTTPALRMLREDRPTPPGPPSSSCKADETNRSASPLKGTSCPLP
jgi:cbb3-type cytochrome oxidase maturation protein